MKTLIETYRGWDIYFDPDKENFYTNSDDYDRQNTKTSFTATKKWIDDYIKDNLEFKPFVIDTIDYYGSVSQKKVIGIRKDKRFVFEGKNGKQEQLSEYEEKNHFLHTEDNQPIYDKLNKLRKQKEDINKLIELEVNKITKEPLDVIKSRYSN